MIRVLQAGTEPDKRLAGLLSRAPGFGAAIWEKQLLCDCTWDHGCYLACDRSRASALAKAGDCGICCGSLPPEKLWDFFRASGIGRVTCPMASPGDPAAPDWGMVMTRMGGGTGALPPSGTPGDCHRLLSQSMADFSLPYDRYYWEMSLRLRRQKAALFCREDAMAAVSFTPFGTLLSQVATLPESRGNGQAGALVEALCRGLSGPIHLFCLPGLAGFYENHSFVITGYWRDLLL